MIVVHPLILLALAVFVAFMLRARVKRYMRAREEMYASLRQATAWAEEFSLFSQRPGVAGTDVSKDLDTISIVLPYFAADSPIRTVGYGKMARDLVAKHGGSLPQDRKFALAYLVNLAYSLMAGHDNQVAEGSDGI